MVNKYIAFIEFDTFYIMLISDAYKLVTAPQYISYKLVNHKVLQLEKLCQTRDTREYYVQYYVKV